MDENRPGYYAIIPADVRYDDSIPANAKLLYGEISALIGSEGYCYASNQYFAKVYGLADESVSRLIAKLEKAGYIKREAERDVSGQIVRRKIFLSVSAPDEQPLDNSVNHHLTQKSTVVNQKVKDTNLSIPDIEKENKKEKVTRPSLTNKQLYELVIPWINTVAGEDCPKEVKVALFGALDGFYAPRAVKKQEPARTEAAFKALTNRLVRFSDGDLGQMIDMLERATTAGWKSVFPLAGDRAVVSQAQPRRNEEWL